MFQIRPSARLLVFVFNQRVCRSQIWTDLIGGLTQPFFLFFGNGIQGVPDGSNIAGVLVLWHNNSDICEPVRPTSAERFCTGQRSTSIAPVAQNVLLVAAELLRLQGYPGVGSIRARHAVSAGVKSLWKRTGCYFFLDHQLSTSACWWNSTHGFEVEIGKFWKTRIFTAQRILWRRRSIEGAAVPVYAVGM